MHAQAAGRRAWRFRGSGWLALTLAEGTYYRVLDPATEAAYLKRVDRAHRGYLAAIKTLAQVRKLGVPALQVNIGEKQVNLSGG